MIGWPLKSGLIFMRCYNMMEAVFKVDVILPNQFFQPHILAAKGQ